MSASRRSFPGIAEAWMARGDGKQKVFAFMVNALSTVCDLDFLGDIAPIITLDENCIVGFDGIEIPINIDTICALDNQGDIDPKNTLSAQCAIEIPIP